MAREARFKWLSRPACCPKGALGFEFDGAAFTHVGERVTFETLMASFDLEQDAALMRVAALVHQLDVGGEPVAEAAGFEAVLAGAHQRLDEDDAATQILDAVASGKREIVVAEGAEAEIPALRRSDPDALFDRMSAMVQAGYAKQMGATSAS